MTEMNKESSVEEPRQVSDPEECYNTCYERKAMKDAVSELECKQVCNFGDVNITKI
jgi:hypothetical protein